ncbi:MAG TPA: MobF family relaxase [Burkholderiales bacterium]|nr:MobF family relaxase [Burkholderiales bacterium]
MLTHHAIENAGRAAHYFSAQDDYYTKEGGGIWLGRGAQKLGLNGEVDPVRFRALLEGRLPDGRRIPATFMARIAAKRHGWDFTFSAPKSVSMQALVAGDQAVIEAHNKAVRAAVALMEKHVNARKKVWGVSHREQTGNLVAAAFQHELSRAKDPQLHTHVVVMNMTERSDGQWRALSNEELFRHTKLIGAAYRASLARELQLLGYEIRLTDKEGGFELAHIDRAQIEVFSQRSRTIEEALDNRGKTRGEASTLEKQVIALVTRPKKDRLTEQDKRLLMELWKEKSLAAGIDYGRGEHKPGGLPRDEHSARESLEFAIAHLTERQSVMLDSMLMTTALQHAVGRATHDELRAELTRRIAAGDVIAEDPLYRLADDGKGSPGKTRELLEKELQSEKRVPIDAAVGAIDEGIGNGRLVRTEARYTTAAAWRTEQSILRMEREGRHRLKPMMDARGADRAVSKTDLNRGQREAALMMLTSENRVTGIQGSAGVGKTYLIRTTADIAERKGYRVVVLAPYANQVERLQAEGLRASTLATFLASKDKDIDDSTLIVIDEAGLVPTRQMDATLQIAERCGSRVVLSGDVQQLKAIEAGRPFAQLQANGMQTAIVDQIQRQRTPDLKPAVELASKGRARESLVRIDRHVREVPDDKARYTEIAREYAAMGEDQRAHTLIVSGTNSARRELNTLIRRELGIEGTGREFETLSRKDLTQAERRNAPSYRIGDYVQPEKDYTRVGLKHGELYRVTEIETRNRLALVGEDGRRLEINPRHHAQLSVYEKSRSELAPGDWARITRNSPALDVSNGDRVRVLDVSAKRIGLENEEGRRIDLDGGRPLHLEHAYATTVHSAQGLSTDRMMVDLDTRSLTTGKDLYYVAISRARYEATVYTNSRTELPAAISREPVKTAALDIQRERETPGMGRTV